MLTVTEVENYVAFLALCTFWGGFLGGTVDPMILDIYVKFLLFESLPRFPLKFNLTNSNLYVGCNKT